MQVRKRITEDERSTRRLKEVERAVQKANERAVLSQVSAPKSVSTAASTRQTSFTLPVVEIKKDMLKNVIYAVFAVGVLVSLKLTNFGFDQIKTLLRL